MNGRNETKASNEEDQSDDNANYLDLLFITKNSAIRKAKIITIGEKFT